MKTALMGFVQTIIQPQLTTFWYLAVPALFALFGTVVWLQKSTCSKRVRILHISSVLLLFWMLFQWNFTHISVSPREITILLDDSPSMTLTDSLGTATEIAAKLENELTSEERNVKIARLSDQSTEPEKTPLGDGLIKILRQNGMTPGVTPNSRRIILLSDGLSNAGSPFEESISEARNRNVNLFPVPLGSPTPLPYVRIESITSPKTVLQGDEIRVKIEVRTNAKNFVLHIFEKDSTVFQKSYSAGSTEFTSCEASWQAKISGEKVYSVCVSLDSQTIAKSELALHKTQVPLSILDRQRRVLLAASRPSWEYRYLRNLLKRSARFDLDVLYLEKSCLPDAKDPLLLLTPPDSSTLSTYDIVILCDPKPSPENASFFETIANSKLGTNSTKLQLLTFLAGRHFNPSDWLSGSFRDFFPFSLIDSGVTSISSKETYHLEPTPIGRTWKILPDFTTPDNFTIYNPISIPHPSPDAQILAQISQSDQSLPAILFQPRGQGGVLFLAMDDTWRLRRDSIETYNNFWATLLTHAVTFSNDFAANGAQDNSKVISNQDLQTITPRYPIEWERTQRDDFVLRTLATKTGGGCFSPDKIDDLVREIRIREQYDDPRIGRRETTFPLWNLLPVWLLFGLLVLVRLGISRRFPQEG